MLKLVLIVCADMRDRQDIAGMTAHLGYRVLEAACFGSAAVLLADFSVDILLCPRGQSTGFDGVALAVYVRAASPATKLILSASSTCSTSDLAYFDTCIHKRVSYESLNSAFEEALASNNHRMLYQ